MLLLSCFVCCHCAAACYVLLYVLLWSCTQGEQSTKCVCSLCLVCLMCQPDANRNVVPRLSKSWSRSHAADVLLCVLPTWRAQGELGDMGGSGWALGHVEVVGEARGNTAYFVAGALRALYLWAVGGAFLGDGAHVQLHMSELNLPLSKSGDESTPFYRC